MPLNDNVIPRLLPLALLTALLVLSYKVVAFFISPVIWAAILAYVTWPLYQWLDNKLGHRANLSAFLTTAGFSLLIGVPVIVGLVVLQQEALNLYGTIIHRIKNGYLNAPDFIKDLPVVGQQIKDALWEINKDPEGTLKDMQSWMQSHLSYGREIVDVLAKNMIKFGIAITTLFFFYRDGAVVLEQVKAASHKILGDRVHNYFNAIGGTTQAVVYGIGLTAVAQGLLAGIGYFAAGAPSPLLLTLMTIIVALIPFGTPFAWGGVVIYLFSQGQTAEAIGLGLWGALVISWVDNLIRPIVISGATKIPFMIILIGVLGGLSAFGFIGLFIGPVVLAIALAVWREWLAQQDIKITKDDVKQHQAESAEQQKQQALDFDKQDADPDSDQKKETGTQPATKSAGSAGDAS